MSTTPPIFPMPEPHHYGVYGFDPQINYFQVLEEARRRRSSKRNDPRPIDSIHFKLKKPISKSKKRKRWWKSAIDFWKRSKSSSSDEKEQSYGYPYRPVYVTETLTGSGEDYGINGLSNLITISVRDTQGEGFPDGFSGKADSVFLPLVSKCYLLCEC